MRKKIDVTPTLYVRKARENLAAARITFENYESFIKTMAAIYEAKSHLRKAANLLIDRSLKGDFHIFRTSRDSAEWIQSSQEISSLFKVLQ